MLSPFTALVVILFISCSSRPGQNPSVDTTQISNHIHDDSTFRQDSTIVKTSFGDTLVVNHSCAVFYIRESSQAEKRHDNAFYLDHAAEFLKKQKVKILRAEDKKYILFKSQGNVSKIIKTDTLEKLGNVYLFDPHKGLIKANVAYIERDFNQLFK